MNVLAVPSGERGRGGGHLSRSAALVRALRNAGAGAWLYPAGTDWLAGSDWIADGDWIDPELLISGEALEDTNWSLVVLDRFRCPRKELQHWKTYGPVLGIDEGLSRNACDFLIDILPGLPEKTASRLPNLAAPSLLPLPRRRRPSFYGTAGSAGAYTGFRNILVSFGAEDPAAATVDAALALRQSGGDFSVTAVLGPLRRNNREDRKLLEEAGVTVAEGSLKAGSRFRESLADYDLVITHFGMTAFEALYARVPVLLLNPGPYHEKLAVHAGLPSAGRGKWGAPRLAAMAGNGEKLAEQSVQAAQRWGLDGEKAGLAELILTARPRLHRVCPLCASSGPRPVAGRFPGRTYRRCFCGAIYLDRLDPPPVEYGRDYFFSAYQKQYGRTYLEDFPALQKLGEKRLDRIAAVCRRNSPKNTASVPRLLDIGCAYGPFLAAAKERGFAPEGIDPAQDAVDYVSERLDIPVRRGFFPEDAPPGPFDAITLWYVIEHFEEPGKALKLIHELLDTGGVLAFSTPSSAGISRRKSLRSFLDKSPGDHWTIWNPRRCAGLLRRYGFRLKKLVVTGHHPERFPLIGGFKCLYPLARILSSFFGLGDTFEAYAVKTGDFHG
jgi:SAM-dependent methyltransferase/spore coat polysaccharide biosynthesis predicted glycosyltransferase SpsG